MPRVNRRITIPAGGVWPESDLMTLPASFAFDWLRVENRSTVGDIAVNHSGSGVPTSDPKTYDMLVHPGERRIVNTAGGKGDPLTRELRIANLSATQAVSVYVVMSTALLNADDWVDPQVSTGAATSTVTRVPAANADTSLLVSNGNRKQLVVYNEPGGAVMYLLLGAGPASATNYTVQVAAGGYFEAPSGPGGAIYTGPVRAFWASATGNAQVTEVAP